MSVQIRKAASRGESHTDWLKSYHSFSFADYYDPEHMSFGPLRVLNDDFIAPDRGFGFHPHRDMEIITYVLAGELKHQDSQGNEGVIRPFEVQRMRAGSGITHSEVNPSRTDELRLLQIWIEPRERGLEPGYIQKAFDETARRGRFVPVVTPDGRDGTLDIRQTASMLVARLEGEQETRYELTGSKGYLHVATGAVTVDGHDLDEGDAARIEGKEALSVRAREASELVLFDLS